MKIKPVIWLWLLLISLGTHRFAFAGQPASFLLEAEAFKDKGGWAIDQQFYELMGSSYLLAQGLGIPVKNAASEITPPAIGAYRVYGRTFNRISPAHGAADGPGRFLILIKEREYAEASSSKRFSIRMHSGAKHRVRSWRNAFSRSIDHRQDHRG
jgi:hypothetical protein